MSKSLSLLSGLINIIHNFNHSSTFQPVTLLLLRGIETTQCIKVCHCVDVLEIMYIAGRGQERLPAVQEAGLIKPTELLKTKGVSPLCDGYCLCIIVS